MLSTFAGHVRRLVLAALLIGAALPTQAAAHPAAPLAPTEPSVTPGPCVERQSAVTPSRMLFCVPSDGWNGDLIVYAHGYVRPDAPLGFANLGAPDGTSLPAIVQSLGFAFATTSYRQNGLAILEGVEDLRETIATFSSVAPRPARRTYLFGVSEGSIITTLLAERHPLTISGGLAACGPIGDFKRQVQYFGDFRVIFDSLFPGVFPDTDPTSISPEVIANWETVYVPRIVERLRAEPDKAQQLIATSNAAIDRSSPEAASTTTVSTTLNVLWYNVFATNDARAKLGGNPYDNTGRLPGLPRFTADVTATTALERYQTSGRLTVPLVTIHTTGDEIIPYEQQTLYVAKVQQAGFRLTPRPPVDRYGHCNFSTSELLFAFNALRQQVDTSSRVFLALAGR